jgi:thioredoxin 1
MFTRTLSFAALAGAFLVLVTVSAGAREAFNAEKFTAAQEAGKPILVDVYAAWCPTCKTQRPIIDSLAADPAYADLVVFTVDFDTQKDALKSFGAHKQSTLIVFKGKTEAGRSVGDTDPQTIKALVDKAAAQ